MIIYLKNSEIDRVKWDNCIKTSLVTRPYAYSWYLDIMAPGWEALVDDDYDSVFPLPVRERFGIKYVTTPVFLQQLGAFSPDKPPEIVIDEFLEFMPEFYKLIELRVGQKVNHKGFRVTEKCNLELDLSPSYEELYSNFNRNCKRNIIKSLDYKPEITENLTSTELINVFQSNKGKEINGIKKSDYQRLSNLIDYCVSNKTGRVVGVRSASGKLLYGLFYIEYKGRMTMIFLVNTPESHEERIGYFVYNELIKKASVSLSVIDFAGSSIPSIASFMSSFGAVNVPYYKIYRNRLLWPVRKLK
jgi:hypothetical protein